MCFNTDGLNGQDVIDIEILPDGTIKSYTDPISGANHQNAEEFLTQVGRFAGGPVTIEAKTDANAYGVNVGTGYEQRKATA